MTTPVIDTTTYRRRGALWLAVVVLVAGQVGILVGVLSVWSSPRYTSSGELLITGLSDQVLENPDSIYVYSEAHRYAVAQMTTWAEIVQSDMVADLAAQRLGVAPGSMRGQIGAKQVATTTVIDFEVLGGRNPQDALTRAEAVANAAVETLLTLERPEGPDNPRIAVEISRLNDQVVDARERDAVLAGVAGGVVGILLGLLVVELRRPGRWISTMLPEQLDERRRQDALSAGDQAIQLEVLGTLLAGQSRRGLLIAAVGLLAVIGYAVTGSPLLPLAAVLAAGVAGLRDLRYPAAAILLCGISPLPATIHLPQVGPVVPTVLEVALMIGVGLTVLHWRPERPRGPFTAPVLAVVAALFVGCLVGIARGADIPPLAEAIRFGAILVSFFVFREAFRGRPQQLLAVLLVMAAVSSILVLAAVPLGWDLLITEGRKAVETGTEVSDVPRLSSPVVLLWSPLLVILAATVVRLRAKWLLLVPGVIHLALSFNRSTWVPLIVFVIAVAALRGSPRAVLARLAQIAVIGTILLALASAGVFGAPGEAIGTRLASVATGEAVGESSLSDRINENGLALRTLRDDPFLGTGVGVPFGPQEVTYDEMQDRLLVAPSSVLHNQYLLIWVLMGVFGLVAYGFLAVRITAFSVHIRSRLGRAAALPVSAATGLALLAVQSTFGTNLFHSGFIVTFAAILALIELSGTQTEHNAPPRPPDLPSGAHGRGGSNVSHGSVTL